MNLAAVRLPSAALGRHVPWTAPRPGALHALGRGGRMVGRAAPHPRRVVWVRLAQRRPP